MTIESLSPDVLLREAAAYVNDNHSPGDPGHHEPSEATWTQEVLRPDQLTNVFASRKEAAAWMANEIEMDEAEELHRDWRALLTEPIREEVVLLIRDDGKAYIWDGWHRAAASIATDRPLAAIVGRPKMDIEPEPARAKGPRP